MKPPERHPVGGEEQKENRFSERPGPAATNIGKRSRTSPADPQFVVSAEKRSLTRPADPQFLEGVDEKDIFAWAKVLIWCAGAVYVIFSLLLFFFGNDEKFLVDALDNGVTFVGGIIALILGLYFGGKKKGAG